MIRRWISPRNTEQETEPHGFDSYDLRLGDLMRGERATMGKSLLDVQRELRIKATFIAAIENADVKAFETPGFIAGYVRSYARYLGMDPDWAFRAFCTESGFEPVHGMSSAASLKPEKSAPAVGGDPLANPNASFVPPRTSIFEGVEPGAVGSVAVLVALVGVLGYGGYSLLQEIQRVEFAPVEQAVGVMDELPGLADSAPFALTGTTPPAQGEGVTAPSIDALDRLYRPEALDVPVLIARDGPISTLDPSQVGVLADVTESEPAPNAVRLAVAAEAAVADALAEDGSVRVFGPDAPEVAIFAVRPLEKILDAGEEFILPRTENVPVLRTGNAGAVYFAVNGTAYGPAGKGPSVVRNIALAPDALTETYAAAERDSDPALADYIAVAEAKNAQ